MSSHSSSEEQFGVQTNVEPQHCTGWRDISSAPRDNSQIVVAQPLDHPGRWTASSMRLVPGDYDFRPGSVWTKLPDLSSSGERSIGSSERQRAEGNPATDELETLRSTVERLTGAWSEVDRLSSANQAMFERLTQALAERDEARRERDELRLEILGGEDVPGVAATVPVRSAIGMLQEERFIQTDRAERAEKQLAEAVGVVETLIRHFEGAEDHDEGAFDAGCADCIVLAEARAFLAQHQSPQSSKGEAE